MAQVDSTYTLSIKTDIREYDAVGRLRFGIGRLRFAVGYWPTIEGHF